MAETITEQSEINMNLTTIPSTSHAELQDVPTSTSPQPATEQFEVDDSNVPTATGTNVAEDERQYPKGAKLVAIFSALAIVLISLGLDISIISVVIPALSDEFRTIKDIGWYSTAPRLVLCSFMFLAGKAYTLFSVKQLFLWSLFIFEVGNVLCTFAQSSNMFIVGRAIVGFGGAGLLTGVFAIFNHAVPLRRRAFYGGIGGAIETVASVAAPVVGGGLTTGWTWRACFGINIPLGIFGCAVIWFMLQLEPNPDESLPLKEKIKRLDLVGTALFAPAVFCLLLALQWGGTVYRWSDAPVVAMFVLSAVLLAGFLLIEWKSGEKAALPFRILRNRSLLAGSFFALCCNATVAVVDYYISIYFQSVRAYSAAKAGILLLPLVIAMCIAAPLAGAFTTWVGYYFQNMYFATIFAAVAVGVLTSVDMDTNLTIVLGMLGLLGFAFGAGIQAPQVAAQTVLEPKEASIGIAIVLFGSQIGPVLFLSAGAALFVNRLTEEVQMHSSVTNVTSIENMGLTEIRNVLGGEALKGVLIGYNEALVQTLYLPLALACLSIVGCIAIERRSVKKQQPGAT